MLDRLRALLLWEDRSPRGRRHRLFCGLCLLLIFVCLAYVLFWYANRGRIAGQTERYRAMYSPAPLTTPAAGAPIQTEVSFLPAATTQVPTSMPPVAETPTVKQTKVSYLPTQSGTTQTEVSISPVTTPVTTASPAPIQTEVSFIPTVLARTPEMPVAPDETLSPLATPDGDTLIVALPTAPPVQESFSELLLYNSDTVGYLMIGEHINLPVVQRENDNTYYLTHNFAGKESNEGALFLDGANRLDDANLIIYGHNMRNGSMFGSLSSYGKREFLLENAVIRFDTIYENACYVPFAMFEASMDADAGHYFNVRQIVFDETSFELFVLKLRNRSVFDIPVDVACGDELLTLVTCSYNDSDGRYIVALRRLRENETEEEMRALVAQAS